MPETWRDWLVQDDDAVLGVLARSRRVAVLGIKPEHRRTKPAFWVPQYLLQHGYDILPVPVYYPETTEILGRPVYRSVTDVPDPVDLVLVFRRPRDIPPHVPDLQHAAPSVVWFQLGIRHDAAARALAEAGIAVVQDRCAVVEHRKLLQTGRLEAAE